MFLNISSDLWPVHLMWPNDRPHIYIFNTKASHIHLAWTLGLHAFSLSLTLSQTLTHTLTLWKTVPLVSLVQGFEKFRLGNSWASVRSVEKFPSCFSEKICSSFLSLGLGRLWSVVAACVTFVKKGLFLFFFVSFRQPEMWKGFHDLSDRLCEWCIFGNVCVQGHAAYLDERYEM